jgi:hypothetical protein
MGAARGAINAGLALIVVSMVGLVALIGAVGAAGKPKMQVLPSPIGVKYRQTVEVKAQNLPKGSGTIALTICGLNNAAGKKIASPTADDCAGANDLNSGLVKLQQWKDGTFDQKYKLPQSGQRFAKNQRFCDAKHYCALVVADANPDKPAYYIATDLQFTDQKRLAPTTTTKPRTPTTKKTTTARATTTTTRPFVAVTARGSAKAGPNGGSASAGGSVSVSPPSGSVPPVTTPSITGPSGPPPNPVPPESGDAVMQACTQLADVIAQGGNDPTALLAACSTLVNGGGGAQLQALLESPSLGCFAASPVTESDPLLLSSCDQLATALQPYSSQLGDALGPAFGLLP